MSGAAQAGDGDGFDRSSRAYRQRWVTLGFMCLSLLIIILDNSILNVALPTLVRDLHATNSELQWMVDSYTLVFAGLLLTAGSLGDRYGRRGALQVGLVLFGAASALSALAGSPTQLIVTRGLMGIGGAAIMPATLSIITNIFPPEERGRAIAIWSGVAALGVLGPMAGGFLLEHFWWGSIFTVNLPIVAVALTGSVLVVPTSRDPARPRQDPVGALLSIVGLAALVYAIIEAPEAGWGSSRTVLTFGLAALVLAGFGLWERRSDHPMLDVAFFRNPRFSAASTGIAAVFFAMFGATFLLTQYMQFVMGYTPFQAGVRMLPWALTMMVVAPSSARLVERVGTKVVVTAGLTLLAMGLLWLATTPVDGTFLGDIVGRMVVMAAGMGLTMAPATESIMGSLPRAKAGVGSAVNDTTRQVGGALGVAIAGSVMSSAYAARVGRALPDGLPAALAAPIHDSLGGALIAARRLGGEQGEVLARAAKEAFMAGMHRGVLVGAGVALVGAFVAWRALPARPLAAPGPAPGPRPAVEGVPTT